MSPGHSDSMGEGVKRTSERQRAGRCLRLLLRLCSGGPVRTDKLLAEHGTSKATFHRDLERLRASGVPVRTTRKAGTSWHHVPRATPGAARSLRDRLVLLSDALRALDAPAPQIASDIARNIDRAMERGLQLEIRYRPVRLEGRAERYLLEPIELHFGGLEPYLLAWKRTDGPPVQRTFKLARIERCEVRSTPCTLRAQASDAFAHAIKAWSGEQHVIAVRFHPPATGLAWEYPFSRGQRVVAEEGGTALVTATVAGLQEATSRVLSWRGQVEAVSPLAFREVVGAAFALGVERHRLDRVVSHQSGETQKARPPLVHRGDELDREGKRRR